MNNNRFDTIQKCATVSFKSLTKKAIHGLNDHIYSYKTWFSQPAVMHCGCIGDPLCSSTKGK